MCYSGKCPYEDPLGNCTLPIPDCPGEEFTRDNGVHGYAEDISGEYTLYYWKCLCGAEADGLPNEAQAFAELKAHSAHCLVGQVFVGMLTAH